jgi:small-conductance mechanosensitive channel
MRNVPSPQQLETAHLEKLRSQLASDIELLQQKEASLRAYEQRLRGLIAQTPSGAADPAAAAADEAAMNYEYQPAAVSGGQDLDAAWEKYNRAHALLEAARRGLVDDRLSLRNYEESLHQREADLARREAWLRVRENELATPAAESAPAPKPKSKPSFTAAPFLLAKNLLSPRRT